MKKDAPSLQDRAAELIAALVDRGIVVATAESCTGGMIAAALTDVAGSSAVLDRGFVTYSNAAKTELLGVPTTMIETFGAVSKEVARAMARGALEASHASVAVAVTGVAGPGGGSEEKPVGLVHLALASEKRTRHVVKRFGPRDRAEIRSLTVAAAFDLLEEAVQAETGALP